MRWLVLVAMVSACGGDSDSPAGECETTECPSGEYCFLPDPESTDGGECRAVPTGCDNICENCPAASSDCPGSFTCAYGPTEGGGLHCL